MNIRRNLSIKNKHWVTANKYVTGEQIVAFYKSSPASVGRARVNLHTTHPEFDDPALDHMVYYGQGSKIMLSPEYKFAVGEQLAIDRAARDAARTTKNIGHEAEWKANDEYWERAISNKQSNITKPKLKIGNVL